MHTSDIINGLEQDEVIASRKRSGRNVDFADVSSAKLKQHENEQARSNVIQRGQYQNWKFDEVP
jgi:hypothetical protein